MDVDTPTLGTKKAKKEFVPKLNKVFVKNLSSDTTSEQLEEVFGNLAPIRRCFVIQKDGKCTGAGYVHYAMEADAKKAVATLNHTKLNGRTLEVSIARPKNATDLPVERTFTETREEPEASSSTKSEKESSRKRASEKPRVELKTEKKEEADKDEDIISTVDITKSAIAQRTVVISGISDDVVYKQLLRKVRKFGKLEGMMYPAAEGADVAYLMYHGADQAAASLGKLQSGFSIGTKPTTVQMFSTTRVNKFRVIVRNLPFKCTVDILKESFAPFGDILQVDLPAGDKPGQIRGFGFVTFTNLKAANKAVSGSTDMKILGRKVAVDLTVGRDQVKRQPSIGASPAASSSMEVDEKKDGSDDDASESEKDGKKEAEDSESSEEAAEESEWPTEVPEFESEDSDDNDNDDDDGGEEKEKDGSKSSKPKSESEGSSAKKSFSSDVHLGQTLFLRNVAFDTTETELFDKFSEWGPLKHAKIVVDRQTGEPRGTAFVHFVNTSDAEKCLKDAYQSQKFANHRKAKKSNDSDLTESDIQIGGRHLIIDVAVTRKSADKLTEERKEVRERKKSDTRNLSLASLSTLSQEQMAELTKEEREKYERGQHEKNMKLANPNFHVSRTRLCVRNLPKTLTEDTLRKMFAKAASSAPGHIGFHQVKVVRDKERGNASRGYGFVEFSDHVHALAALEAIHGKHQSLAKNNRLFVEFAVEDSRVLQAREFRLSRSKEEGKKTRKEDNKYERSRSRKSKKGLEEGEEEESSSSPPSNNAMDTDAAAADDDDGSHPEASSSNGGDDKKSRKGSRKNDKNDKKRKRAEIQTADDDEASTIPKRGNKSRDSKGDERRGPKADQRQQTGNRRDFSQKTGKPSGRPLSVLGVSKGSFAAPAADSRRGATSKSRQHEEALEKMIGEYQKSLDTGSKKRWFD
jgi:nucleolar protein 4